MKRSEEERRTTVEQVDTIGLQNIPRGRVARSTAVAVVAVCYPSKTIMVAASYQQRQAIQWSIVALTSLLAIASFLAAFYHRKGRDLILRSDVGRHRRRSLQQNTTMVCNGLANLCDLPANKILYATLHNANTDVVHGSLVSHSQVRDLEKAVAAGYRGINFDIGKCNGKVQLGHGTCLLSTRDIETVLQHLLDFLNANPNEVIIIPAEITVPLLGAEAVTLAEIDQVFQSVPGWKEKLYDHPGPGQPWPTLSELIAADTRILFFHYNGETCTKTVNCPTGFHPWFQYAVETQFSFKTVQELQDTAYSCNITRGRGGTRDFFGVNVFVTPPRKVAALRVNAADFLKPHVQACTDLNGGLQANLILVDYWGLGNVLDVVHELNAAL
jgi:hypothetical protein